MQKRTSEHRGLWQELKRRDVVKVTAAYAAAAFVVLQVLEIVLPALGLPDWTMTWVVILGVLGLPVSIALSWAFNLTPDGLRRTHDHGDGEAFGPRAVTLVRGGIVVGALATLALAGWWVTSVVRPDRMSAADPSVAVLPFVDMSSTGDQAYLGEGLAEEILNLLTRLPGLHVAARTSAFMFAGQSVDIRDVGRQLSVRHVLEGSVRMDANQVRITAQLINVEDGFHVWSRTYDRKLESVFEVQDEIAQAIVSALGQTLTGQEQGRLESEPISSGPAYEAYLRGRTEQNRRSPDGIRAAINYFAQALELDPYYAKAHAGMADSWALFPLYDPTGGIMADDAWSRAEHSASTALLLDPTSAEALASQGLIAGFKYDLEGGMRDMTRALELKPAYAPAHHWLALVMSEMGRHDEAVEHARTAATLDPLSLAVRADLGYAQLWAGDYAGAERSFRDALELSGTHPPAWFGLALTRLWTGDAEGSVQAAVEWASATGESQEGVELIFRVAAAGEAAADPDQAAAAIEGLASASSATRATLHALIDDRDAAIRWLERSKEDRSYVTHFPMANSAFDKLRALPAFAEFLVSLKT